MCSRGTCKKCETKCETLAICGVNLGVENAELTPESGVSRLGFEPRTLGLKVRCSAKLSYRPTKVEGATCTGSSSMDHRNILEACAVPFMIPPPTRL